MTHKKNAVYQRERRLKLRDKGFKIGEVWVAPQDWPTIRELEKKLQKQFLEGDK